LAVEAIRRLRFAVADELSIAEVRLQSRSSACFEIESFGNQPFYALRFQYQFS
jgi:hypothetical protein